LTGCPLPDKGGDTAEAAAPVCPAYTGIVDGAEWTYRSDTIEAFTIDVTAFTEEGAWRMSAVNGSPGTFRYDWEGYCDAEGSWDTFEEDAYEDEFGSSTTSTYNYLEPALAVPVGLASGSTWTRHVHVVYDYDGVSTDESDFSYDMSSVDAGRQERPSGSFAALQILHAGTPFSVVAAEPGDIGDGGTTELVSYTP
jgi:hypothetical protein